MNELRQEITDLQQEIKILRDELAVYRWRDKKVVILKELGLTRYLTTYNRAEIINAYETNRLFALIEALFINQEADDLLSKGYTIDEIIKAVREWVKERLDEIEKEKKKK